MARYTGPDCRICRRHGEKLFLKGERCMGPKCAIERRNYPPGPRSARRRKVSDRGLQLREKQKARFAYGVLERQFRRYYEEAARRPGVPARTSSGCSKCAWITLSTGWAGRTRATRRGRSYATAISR